MPKLSDHPLSTYKSAMRESRGILAVEMGNQNDAIEAGSLTVDERNQAGLDALELASAISHLDDADLAFIVALAAGMHGPDQAIVDETIALNKKLAQAVVDRNAPGVYLNIVSGFLDGAISVVTGKFD